MKTKESRFQVHDELTAPEGSVPILKGALAGGGQLPNFIGVMAGSPAVLRSYARFRSELRNGSLAYATQQRIALAVAEHQGSEYALSTLQRTGRDAGLGMDEIALAREFDSYDEKEAVLLRFVKAVLQSDGAAQAPLPGGGARGGLGGRADPRGDRPRGARHVREHRDPRRRRAERRVDRGLPARAGGLGRRRVYDVVMATSGRSSYAEETCCSLLPPGRRACRQALDRSDPVRPDGRTDPLLRVQAARA